MEGQPLEPDADVTALPHGTKVGAWWLKSCRGRGAYGTVYRAVREGDGYYPALGLCSPQPRDVSFIVPGPGSL
jgi:hypothetical protein